MKIITTTGFYGTGSSAITDLVKEYGNVSCKSDFEIRFLHDPYGVSDLEYNLIENPNRHNTSHAIKKFRQQMKLLDHVGVIKRYSKYFNHQFMKEIDSYIENITICSYKAAWHYDVYERGKTFYFISRLYAKINSLLHKLFKVPLDGRALIPKSELAYLGILDEKRFLNETQKLVYKLALVLNEENKEYIMLDQLVPPSNIKRYLRYIDKLKVVVVDRDPRDIYLLEKEIWNGTVVPCESVEVFCQWYDWTRRIYYNQLVDENVLNIAFEDLIYNYDETKTRIEEHFGLKKEQHIYKKMYFDPAVSIRNTQLWHNIKGYEKEIEYISKRLEQYCYKFPLKTANTLKNSEFF